MCKKETTIVFCLVVAQSIIRTTAELLGVTGALFYTYNMITSAYAIVSAEKGTPQSSRF